MKKTILIGIVVLLIPGCLTFDNFLGREPANAAEELVEALRIEQEKSMDGSLLKAQKLNYMVSVFDVVALPGQELSEDELREFRQLVYAESQKRYDYRNYFSPEEIDAKEKELGDDVKGYEIRQRKIAKSLGADYIILGKMHAEGFNLWNMNIKIIDLRGNVQAAVDHLSYKQQGEEE